MDNLRIKKPNRQLSLRRRHGLGQNLTSNDQVKLYKLYKQIFFGLLLIRRNPKEMNYKNIVKSLIRQYIEIKYVVDIDLVRTTDLKRNLFSFGQSVKKDLRFEANDLRILVRELRFQDKIKLDNGMVMSGEEVFIRGLFELVSGCSKSEIANQFGRDFSAQSRAFSYFINHIYNNF
jgi:hypothetical protein